MKIVIQLGRRRGHRLKLGGRDLRQDKFMDRARLLCIYRNRILIHYNCASSFPTLELDAQRPSPVPAGDLGLGIETSFHNCKNRF